MNSVRHLMVLAALGVAWTTGNALLAVQVNTPDGPVHEYEGCSSDTAGFCDLRIYEVMVEAFVDGDPNHDYNAGYGTSHHKGDLRGIINSLDYIKGLGMNAIWMTPIFNSHAGEAYEGGGTNLKLDATGYYTRNYFEIDPKFGTLADAQELVDTAHAMGMYVFFDGVFGHHKGNLVPSPTGKLPVNSSPGVVDYSYFDSIEFYQEVATYWIEELGIDGWRLDQAYQVPPSVWRDIRTSVEDASAQRALEGEQWGTLGYMVAELWGGADFIDSAGYGSDVNPVLHSAFDFPVRYAIVGVVAGEESGLSGRPASVIADNWAYGAHANTYPDHALPNLMIGNHDLVRFGDLLQRADIADPEDPEYWARHRLAFMAQAAYTGPITRYYGEEIGDEVPNYADKVTFNCANQGLCDDHVARTSAKILDVTVDAEDLSADQLELLQFHQDLMNVRAQYPALSHGSRQHLYSDTNLYVDLKTWDDQQIVFAMNTSNQTLSIQLSESLFDAVPPAAWDILEEIAVPFSGGYMELLLPPLSGSYILLAAPPLPGDYNENGVVDAGDYTVWRNALAAGSTTLPNDPTPGTVDQSDYDYWRSNYGNTAGGGASMEAGSVPEPATLGLCLLAAIGLAVVRRTSARWAVIAFALACPLWSGCDRYAPAASEQASPTLAQSADMRASIRREPLQGAAEHTLGGIQPAAHIERLEPPSEQPDSVETHVPQWAADAIFYQIFPERFRNGDSTNDPTRDSLERPESVPESWEVTSWTGDWYARAPWEVEMGSDFFKDGVFHRRYGGDLQGVIDKLDYLRELGINAIYFNPVFYARSLHKYDGNTYHHIDPYFGPDPPGDFELMAGESNDPASWHWTAADRLFLELIRQAHARGIRVIIDGVFNHTGRDFFAFADLRKNQAESPYRDWYIVQSFDDPATPENEFRYNGWWGVMSLPEFADNAAGDDLHPEPKKYILDITRRWLDPNGDGEPSDGIDGWRLDVANEVPLKFWRDWHAVVRSINPDAYTVAEIWNDAEQFLREGHFSATMNYYGFAFPVKGFVIDGSFPASGAAHDLDERREVYPEAMQYALQNLIDSHDTDRVASMIVNAGRRPYTKPERFDYDTNVSPRHGSGYDVRRPNDQQRRIQRLVALLQMTYVGAPMVYYGTEAGMWGADDPSDRMPMVWPDLKYEPQRFDPLGRSRKPDRVEFDDSLFQFYRAAIWLRRQMPVLRHGEIEFIRTDDTAQFLAFRRFDDQDSLLVGLHRGGKPYEWKIPLEEGQSVSQIFVASGEIDEVKVNNGPDMAVVSLPPREGVVLRLEQRE